MTIQKPMNQQCKKDFFLMWSQSKLFLCNLDIFFPFFAIKLCRFIVFTLIIIFCYKHSSLTTKFGKRRKSEIGRIESWLAHDIWLNYVSPKKVKFSKKYNSEKKFSEIYNLSISFSLNETNWKKHFKYVVSNNCRYLMAQPLSNRKSPN